MTTLSNVAEWAHLPVFLTGSGILNDLLSSRVWLPVPKVGRLSRPCAFNSGAAHKKNPPFYFHEPSHLFCHVFSPRPNTMPKGTTPPPHPPRTPHPIAAATWLPAHPPLTSDLGIYFNHPFLQHLGWVIGLEREGEGCMSVVKFRALYPQKVYPHLWCTKSLCEYERVLENMWSIGLFDLLAEMSVHPFKSHRCRVQINLGFICMNLSLWWAPLHTTFILFFRQSQEQVGLFVLSIWRIFSCREHKIQEMWHS